jgi:plasmid maintenance system killer protein
VEVLFKNSKEKELYQDIRALRRDFGDVMAKLIIRRLNEIEAIGSVGELLNKKIGKAHILTGNYKHCIGLHLTGNYRLVINPLYEKATDFSSVDFQKVCTVKVVEVVDYHG